MDYIAQDSPAAALDVDDEIERQVETLMQNPELGRRGRVRGARELVIARTQLITIYTVDANAGMVKVLRVLSARQDYPKQEENNWPAGFSPIYA